VRRDDGIRLETRGPRLHAEAPSRSHPLEVTGRNEALGGPMKTHEQDRGGSGHGRLRPGLAMIQL
jgi:hypothetical protein